VGVDLVLPSAWFSCFEALPGGPARHSLANPDRMNVRLNFSDENGLAHYFLEADSARLSGSRSAFGAALLISMLTPHPQPTNDVPLLFFGALTWANENEGLPIPAQSIRGGHSALVVPISDAQIAAIESVRKAGDPFFALRLALIAQNERGEVRQYGGQGGMDSYPYTVPAEVWYRTLDACGFGASAPSSSRRRRSRTARSGVPQPTRSCTLPTAFARVTTPDRLRSRARRLSGSWVPSRGRWGS